MAESLAELTLIRAHDQKRLNVLGALVDDGISYSFAYYGSNTITVTLHDPDWALLTSGFFDRNTDDRLDAVDVKLDGQWWRLTQVNPSGSVLTLTFEERAIQRLRFKFGALTVSRNASTRAEFVRRLVKSIMGGYIGFYSRELKDKQPIAQGTSSKTTADTKDPGVASHASFTVKGEAANAEQKANVAVCLRVAQEVGATAKPVKAMFVAAIGESSILKGAAEQVYGTHKGVFQSNQIPASDLEAQAKHFLTGGRSFREGGAIQAAKDHPDWSVGKIASYVEISDADGSFYDKYADEADAIMKAGGSDLPESVEVAKSYQFAVAEDEDYYAAIVRLAEEVNWRAFMHRGVFYFMDDYQLLRGTPQWLAKCITGEQVSGRPTFEWDNRGAFPQTMTIDATLPRGYLAPGDTVDVTEAGPANGRWIVAEVAGTWYGQVITITLNLPQAPKKEPAHETTTSTSDEGGAGGLRAKIVAEAEKSLSTKTGHNYYSQGGALTENPTPPQGERSDCSQWARAVYLKAGASDPGTYTGEMLRKGKTTSKPRPGDLLCGPDHVELYVGDGKTIGHGSPPIDYDTSSAVKARGSGMRFITYDFLDD